MGDRVLGAGDTLLGRTVANIVFGRERLNDDGQLAFTARFTDGTSAVVLATPDAAEFSAQALAPVPEPTTWARFAAGLLTTASTLRRRAQAAAPSR